MIKRFSLFENSSNIDMKIFDEISEIDSKSKQMIVLVRYIGATESNDINDGSIESETIKAILHDENDINIDISVLNYLILGQVFFKKRADIFLYILQNFKIDMNNTELLELLELLIYGEYFDNDVEICNKIITTTINNPEFDPSYNDSALLSVAVEGNRIDVLEVIIKDKRVDIKSIETPTIIRAVEYKRFDILELLLPLKTEIDYTVDSQLFRAIFDQELEDAKRIFDMSY